ncbi:interferon omega-1-like [Erinaceus europaeus]|uniref:Interferon omega-1-like n=1 Tax=Erinaceus europaeus TaxID=9365 RepID=A0A1S3WRQ2_ERIEU|nr:interferon omega-1-like [Erinaceus europaeus]
MAFSVSSLVVLVMILSSPIYSTSCNLPLSLTLENQETVRALDQVGTVSLLSCLNYRTNFKFAKEQLDGQFQKAQAMSIVHETVQQVFHLFFLVNVSAAWDKTLLDLVRTGLHQQLEYLDSCLVQLGTEEDSALSYGSASLEMKRYFRRIRLYLKEKKYSVCAWEVVRVEIKRCFLFINKFIRTQGLEEERS